MVWRELRSRKWVVEFKLDDSKGQTRSCQVDVVASKGNGAELDTGARLFRIQIDEMWRELKVGRGGALSKEIFLAIIRCKFSQNFSLNNNTNSDRELSAACCLIGAIDLLNSGSRREPNFLRCNVALSYVVFEGLASAALIAIARALVLLPHAS